MKRVVLRRLPDGSFRNVQPFHVSMAGLERTILCRDEEDYDAMVKILCVSARRKNVVLVIYAVVSNHCHAVVLARYQQDADDYGGEVKRMTAMWFSRKYGESGVLKGTDVKAICLDSDWYVRSALAYVPRNALDNGCNVNEYPWSGYRAMFSQDVSKRVNVRPVSSLHRDEMRRIMHTADKLKDVPWLLDDSGRLIPSSICDSAYLEQAFGNDQSFFLRTIGSLNPAEMNQKLIDNPRKRLTDSEFYKHTAAVSLRWFKAELSRLSLEQKARLIPYISRTMKTSVPQLARTFGLNRDMIRKMLGRPPEKKKEEAVNG
ncbi:MAG: hypothetical protein IJL68_04170 [Bacteroidales bacterium]|nr:hypothetical protein [Bacteroidales bacterium]